MRTSNSDKLRKIISYCEKIQRTINRYGNNYSVFEADSDYRDSVSMNVLQIGELAKKLDPEFRMESEPYFHWKVQAGMRDHYAHGYEAMDPEIIWDTITNDIPILKHQCEEYLALCNEQDEPEG